MIRADKMPADPVRELQRDLKAVESGSGWRMWQIFSDWIECCAIALSNSADHEQREDRGARYMQHVERYGADNMNRFASALRWLIEAMEAKPEDLLGRLFMGMDFGDKHMGQFFTPYELQLVMAKMVTSSEEIKAVIEERGFVTLNEPTCGAGGMVVAFAERMKEDGLNPQTQLHVTAQDLDLTAVHMTYVQLSLLGIPAVVICGNTLAVEVRSVWRTPFHMLHGWEWRLRRNAEAAPEPKESPAAPPPVQERLL